MTNGTDAYGLAVATLAPARYPSRPRDPGLRRRAHEWLFRRWYWYVNRIDRQGELRFLNYGYAHGGRRLALDPRDEPDRYGVQLYRHVAEAVKLEGQDIVEVGCGRGGGLDYLVRTFRPASAIGLDLAPAAVEFCRRRYHQTGLAFRRGDAQELDLGDASCDVVLNIESSHRYTRMAEFLAGVRRILRPGGFLLLADFRSADEMPALRRALSRCGLEIRYAEDITASVTAALRRDDFRRRRLVRRMIPRLLRKPALDFAGTVGSPTYTQFSSRELLYGRFVLQKV